MRTPIGFLALILIAQAQTSAPAGDYTISGVVVDHLTNRALNHVLVEINTVGKDGGEASVLTEEDGRFHFLHVPIGKYNLQAQKRGQAPQAFHSTDGGFSTAIVVDGKLKTDDIAFAIRTPSVITGTVIGDDGEPVRNAQIHLLREAVTNGEAATVQMRGSNTNSEGQFHIGQLEPGKYYVAVSGTPWFSDVQAEQEMVYPVTYYGDTTDAASARAVNLTEGASAALQIQLHTLPGIRVKVANNRQGFSLSVQGPGNSRIQVPTLLVSQGQPARRGAVQLPSEGTEPPELELHNLPAGHYLINSVGQRGESGQMAVDLANGSTLSVNDGNSATSVLTGKIIFDTPRPGGEMRVFLSGAGRGVEADVTSDGSFKFDGLHAGTFDINIGTSNLVTTSMEAKGARMVHDRVEVSPGTSASVVLHMQSAESMAKIDGVAVRGESGVPGAMVLLLPKDLSHARLIRRDQSDLDGSFTLANVLPGNYTLVAIDDGKDLAYRDEKIIKPYLENGLAINVGLKTADIVKAPVQVRKHE